MNTTNLAPGITFAVDDVVPATMLLPTCKTQDAVRALVGSPVQACSIYTDNCVSKVGYHPLIAATHFAFSQHRPLVLSPDMIWVTILQGFAEHVKQNAERFRYQLVRHADKKTLAVERNDLVQNSAENPWHELVHDFSTLIRAEIGSLYADLIADFSTTGPLERTACEIALLDAFQPYFQYVAYAICGIPSIRLEGTPDDWSRLRAKVEHLASFDFDWWLPDVRHICDQFRDAAAGTIDIDHWRSIYKIQSAYGGERINGWIIKLIPYLEGGNRSGSFKIRNPYLSDPTVTLTTAELPAGISKAPFVCVWANKTPAKREALEFLGGFLGVTQDADTMALRPKLGWAVRAGDPVSQWVEEARNHHVQPRLGTSAFDAAMEGIVARSVGVGVLDDGLSLNRYVQLPEEFFAFYKLCNGCDLFPNDPAASIRIHGLDQMPSLPEFESLPPMHLRHNWDRGIWLRFAELPDGSFLAMESCYTFLEHPIEGVPQLAYKMVRGTAQGKAPVVAWSFMEVLDQLLAGHWADLKPVLLYSPAKDWWSQSDESLLRQCNEVTHTPTKENGQKRPRHFLFHNLSRCGTFGEESDSQTQRRASAVRALRHSLAFEHRQLTPSSPLPAELQEACANGLILSADHPRFHYVAAAVLDILNQAEGNANVASQILGVNIAQLERFFDTSEDCRAEAQRIAAHHGVPMR